MPRHFSFLLLITSLCIILQLLSFIEAVDDHSCEAASKSLICANLGNVSFPFGDEAPCAKSDSFNLSGCTGTQAYWEPFTAALGKDDAIKLGPPAVMEIIQINYLSFINLVWNMTLLKQNVCEALSADKAHTYVPEDINLNSFANGSFLVSYYNNILLLNCSKLPSSPPSDVQVDSPTCKAYEEECNFFPGAPCAEIAVPTKELALLVELERYSCSHFQMFVNDSDNTAAAHIPSLRPGLLQVFFGDVKCVACALSNGTCTWNRATNPPTFQACACGNTISDSDCLHLHLKRCKVLCSTGAKFAIAIVMTVVAVVLLLFFAALLYYCMKRKENLSKPLPLTLANISTTYESISRLNFDRMTQRPVEYSYASIASATNFFNHFLGKGGFGAVYKGTLPDASGNLPMQIAVKVLEIGATHNNKQFLTELATIGRIHHFHVVRLVGFCIQESTKMLVYEYMINGSLDKWLFDHGSTRNQVLHWEQRYAIALGIAKGLSYLHEECRHRIVHRDIKPQNILLDEEMCPKIADFGLARLMSRNESQVATFAQGTPGYIAPEFWLGGEGQLSTKLDVYSYGMVLLELMSGHQNFEGGQCFPKTAFEAAMAGNFESIVDVKLGMCMQPPGSESENSKDMQWHQVRIVLFVALWCIQDQLMCRPSMSEVVKYLEGVAAISEHPPPPVIAYNMSALICNQTRTHLSSHHHHEIIPLSGGR